MASLRSLVASSLQIQYFGGTPFSSQIDAEIEVGNLLETVEWDYPNFHLTMHCYLCSLVSESLHLNEHNAAAWLTAATLESVKWLPADEVLLDKIRNIL